MNQANVIARAPSRGTLAFLSLENVFYFLILSSVLVFVLWPMAAVLLKSVVVEGRVDFSEYARLFQDDMALLANSVFVAGLSTMLSLCFGTCIALYLTHCRGRGKRLVFSVLLLVSWVGSIYCRRTGRVHSRPGPRNCFWARTPAASLDVLCNDSSPGQSPLTL
ncbi:MAG: hypothetical protein ACOCWR_00260 [Oceanidesulfovibrio sp.]